MSNLVEARLRALAVAAAPLLLLIGFVIRPYLSNPRDPAVNAEALTAAPNRWLAAHIVITLGLVLTVLSILAIRFWLSSQISTGEIPRSSRQCRTSYASGSTGASMGFASMPFSRWPRILRSATTRWIRTTPLHRTTRPTMSGKLMCPIIIQGHVTKGRRISSLMASR